LLLVVVAPIDFDSQIGQFIAKLRNVNRRFSKGQSKLSLRRMAKIESFILLKKQSYISMDVRYPYCGQCRKLKRL